MPLNYPRCLVSILRKLGLLYTAKPLDQLKRTPVQPVAFPDIKRMDRTRRAILQVPHHQRTTAFLATVLGLKVVSTGLIAILRRRMNSFGLMFVV